MSTYSKARAKASDRQLAEAQTALYEAMDRQERAQVNIIRKAGGRQVARTADRFGFNIKLEQAIEMVAAAVEDQNALAYNREQYQTALERLDALDAEVAGLRAKVAHLDNAWRDNGMWGRFFLVQDGHIHRSTSCQSLRITTRIGWLPELSGETEEDAVKQYGSVLCTHCFPSAPVEWTTKAPKAEDPTLCAMSGKYIGATMTDKEKRLYRKYTTCPECGNGVSVTSTMKARKHKK